MICTCSSRSSLPFGWFQSSFETNMTFEGPEILWQGQKVKHRSCSIERSDLNGTSTVSESIVGLCRLICYQAALVSLERAPWKLKSWGNEAIELSALVTRWVLTFESCKSSQTAGLAMPNSLVIWNWIFCWTAKCLTFLTGHDQHRQLVPGYELVECRCKLQSLHRKVPTARANVCTCVLGSQRALIRATFIAFIVLKQFRRLTNSRFLSCEFSPPLYK